MGAVEQGKGDGRSGQAWLLKEMFWRLIDRPCSVLAVGVCCAALRCGFWRDRVSSRVVSRSVLQRSAMLLWVATHCDGCIGFHTKALKRLGATDEEVSEALGVTVYMGGGPSLMYAADAWNAWQALKEG